MDATQVAVIKIVASSVVWVVAILTIGRVGMFVATQYFAHLRQDATTKPTESEAASALRSMSSSSSERT